MTARTIKIKNFLWRVALKRLVRPNKVVNVNGNKMFLDSKDSLLLSIRKNYEPKHVNLLKKIIKEGDWVVDIGAHIGYYTLLMAQLVGPKGKVYAFEPDPENFRVLERNVKENGYNNIVIENKAVSDNNGKTNLFLSRISKGDTRIYKTKEDDEREDESKYEVETVRLDDYFKKNRGKIKFFKIDIQGVEPLAFRGMQRLLDEKKIKFTMEFSPELLNSAGFDSVEFLESIKKRGFSLFDVDQNRVIQESQTKELVRHYTNINYFTTIYSEK